jgi:hypothetical protein
VLLLRLTGEQGQTKHKKGTVTGDSDVEEQEKNQELENTDSNNSSLNLNCIINSIINIINT